MSTSVTPRAETIETSGPCLRVPPAFHARVPSRSILQREGRSSPAVRAGASLIRGKLASLTHQTLGRGPDELFLPRQGPRWFHVPSSRRTRRPRAAVVFPGQSQRKEGPRLAIGSRAQPEPLTTPCRRSVCRAIRAGRPAIFWTTEYRPPSVTS